MAGKPRSQPPWFKLFKDSRKQWRFTLIGGNGEPMLTGEGYSRRSAAIRAIDRLRNALWLAKVKEVP